MKKVWLICLLIGVASNVNAWPRIGAAANIVTKNNGNKGRCLSVLVGTTTPVLLYTSSEEYRETLLQNSSTSYYVFCGTFSAVNASTGTPKFFLPPKPSGFTTNGNYNIYCVGEPSAGAGSIEINGILEYNVPD